MRNLVKNFTISVIILISISWVITDLLNLEINTLALISFSISTFLLKYVEALSLPFAKLFESKLLSILIGLLKILGIFFFVANVVDILVIFTFLNLTKAIIQIILYRKSIELQDTISDNLTSTMFKIWITLVANYFLYKSLLYFIDGEDSVGIIKVGLSIQLVLMLESIGTNIYHGVEDKIINTIKINDIHLLRNQLKDIFFKLALLDILITCPLLLLPNYIEQITGMPLHLFSVGELFFIGFIVLLVSITSVSSSVLIHMGVFTSHYTAIFQVILMLLCAKLAITNNWSYWLMYIPWVSQIYNFAYRPYQLYKQLTPN
jgi:hypothetical protein